ncbi:MAG: hypothetical protein J1E38_03195 [Paramuribaculum sp.]|nr:hypothetical protein [Paramuribaculum sp.]
MDLEEMKNNMTLIDKLLAKTNGNVRIDSQRAGTAKSKLEKKYKETAMTNLLLGLVFFLIWFKLGNDDGISFPYRLVIPIVALIGSLWYYYLYRQVKAIDIYSVTPAQLFSKITSLKLQIISGEIVVLIILSVIFSVFLPQIFEKSVLGFWLCVATIAAAILLAFLVYIPRYRRIFSDLTSIKE